MQKENITFRPTVKSDLETVQMMKKFAFDNLGAYRLWLEVIEN